MKYRFSVIIPLYNKRSEIRRAIQSALSQSYAPFEIIVVDDGSTDGSADEVESIQSDIVRLIRQQNAGETAARNRGMSEASGDWFALLDADDEWKNGFLAETAAMIDEYPDCGIYCTGFDIVASDRIVAGNTPQTRGIVKNYFQQSMKGFVATASSSVLNPHAVSEVGGFPEGMRLGGDQYMWTKLAERFKVCFSPSRQVAVYTTANNRSVSIYRPEQTIYSFEDFLDSDNFWLREYAARVALGKAIVLSVKGDSEAGRRAERAFAFNRHSRRLWYRLWLVNRLPKRWRPTIHSMYVRLAWKIAGRGL